MKRTLDNAWSLLKATALVLLGIALVVAFPFHVNNAVHWLVGLLP